MKKKQELEEHQELEILKAVAQAWYGHSGTTRPTNEFDAYRSHYKPKPTRFKLEAMNKLSKEVRSANWDFAQSLWDSYEIVTLSKRLEAGLVLDNPVYGSEGSSRVIRRRKEGKNSLRNLFHRMSSKRCTSDDNFLRKDDVQF